MDRQYGYCFCVFITIVTAVLGGEFCNFQGETHWCYYDCCELSCCDVSNVGLIVGLTLGGLVTCIVVAVVCCFVRRRWTYGHVICTNTTPSVVVATHTSSSQQPVYPSGGYYPGMLPAQPMGPQNPPIAQPAAAAMAPPAYSQAKGQENQGFNYMRFS